MAVLQDININVYAQPSEKRLRTFLTLSQNENGRLINFRILGAPLPSNCTATFSGTKPDGNVYSTTGTVTGNFVVVAEDMQMTAVAGVWDAKLDIINGTHNIMTALIRVVVDADVVDPDAIASDSQLQGLVAEAKYYAEEARIESFGAPLTAALKADMLDKTRVYVYTGSETGMTAGHWYYWDGSAWTDGGVYNAAALDTDKTLSVPDKAADGKATGDALALKVDKVTGKGLSTNDYTTAEKTKLSGIAEGATKVEIDSTLSTTGKAADAKKTGDEISQLKNLLFKPTDFRNLNVDFTANPNQYLQEDGTLVSLDDLNVSNIIEIPSDSSGYIRVTGYKFFNAIICVFYDASQTPIDYYPHTAEQTLIVSNQIVKIPKTAKYFRFCDSSYRSIISNTVIEISTGMGVSNNVWNGKKWVCVGDSLTEVNSKTTKHYFDYVSDATGISVVNMGVPGTGYAGGQESNNAFHQRVANVPIDADVVTIFGSFNDITTGLPIGSVTDSGVDTIAGCINTTINNLFEVFPLVNLGIITPTPWPGYNPWNGSAVGNEYVQMIIDICKKRGLMCLDLYHCSELRPWQSSYLPLAYSKDNGGGAHPDETGHAIIAPKFQGFLNSLLLH